MACMDRSPTPKRRSCPLTGTRRHAAIVFCLALLWGSFAPAAVTQPGAPASGPGSPQYRHATVRQLEFGSGNEQCWVFLPEEPTPETAPLIIFLHGWGGVQPRFYGAWIHHLVRRGAVVVFPRYQASLRSSPADMTSHAATAVRSALQKLERMAPPRLDLGRTALVGHSLGGVIACNLTAHAREKGLPVPRCLMVVEPGDSRPEHPLVPRLAERIPSIVEKDYSGIPADVLVLVLVGEDDRIVGADTARRLFRAMTSVPPANRNLVRVCSDRHGDPPLIADHLAPVCNADPVTGKSADRPRLAIRGRPPTPERGRTDTLDRWACWRLFDALTDAAWWGAPRGRALGGSPNQTSMGKWSDGRPVAPLKLLEAPPLSQALRAATLRGTDGVFDPEKRLLTTYFFSRGPWDDTRKKTGRNGGPWPESYPLTNDPFAKVFGLDSPLKWPGNRLPDSATWPTDYHHRTEYPLWLMAEWRAMKWCRFDLALVDVWPCLWFTPDGSARFAFRALADAWNELDRRGEHPIPLALFLETPFGWLHPKQDGDATQTSKDGIAEIWEPTRAFLRQFYGDADTKPLLPLRALARIEIDGEARPILQYWFPFWPPKNGHGLRKWNEWTIRELRRKCRESFGVSPYIGVSQHVHGPKFIGGWNSIQPDGDRVEISSKNGIVDYDIAWWGGLLGPQVYQKAIVLGPGHWMRDQTGNKVPSRHWDPNAYAPDEFRYLYCWRKVLTHPANFQKNLLIVESWNNTLESCAVCYCTPKDYRTKNGEWIDRWGKRPEAYMEWTRRLAPYWKTGRCPKNFPPMAAGPATVR